MKTGEASPQKTLFMKLLKEIITSNASDERIRKHEINGRVFRMEYVTPPDVKEEPYWIVSTPEWTTHYVHQQEWSFNDVVGDRQLFDRDMVMLRLLLN